MSPSTCQRPTAPASRASPSPKTATPTSSSARPIRRSAAAPRRSASTPRTATSGNFCGYLSPDKQRSYYTLHFVAEFDRPFAVGGTWTDETLHPGATSASGGTGYGKNGFPEPGKGSGGWISFGPEARDVT